MTLSNNRAVSGRVHEWRRHRYRGQVEDAAWLAIVHVSSHSRQRHNVLTVIVLASVSMILPEQKGHVVGRVTGSSSRA